MWHGSRSLEVSKSRSLSSKFTIRGRDTSPHFLRPPQVPSYHRIRTPGVPQTLNLSHFSLHAENKAGKYRVTEFRPRLTCQQVPNNHLCNCCTLSPTKPQFYEALQHRPDQARSFPDPSDSRCLALPNDVIPVVQITPLAVGVFLTFLLPDTNLVPTRCNSV